MERRDEEPRKRTGKSVAKKVRQEKGGGGHVSQATVGRVCIFPPSDDDKKHIGEAEKRKKRRAEDQKII